MLHTLFSYRKISILLISMSAILTACQPQQEAEMTNPESQASVEYDLGLNMKDFMNLVMEPTADVLWDTAGWVNSREGYYELYPTTDEEWHRVRQQAAIIKEIGNMLALPGRAVDNDAWVVYSKGISQAATMAMTAAEEQNKEDYFQAGARLYSACTACHQAYNPEITNRFN
ncbi:MAG: hypothetical protein R3332_03215 [Pseudohongiellaceae bacterium]|nr:hypothetical protein [Pseudohongiellaceae bacterium]